MKKILLGSFLASIALFIWGSIYWMGPWTGLAMKGPADDALAQSTLAALFPASGTYFVPYDTTNMEKMMELHRQGPLAMVQIRQSGAEPMSPMLFLTGWVHMLGLCLLLGWLLHLLRDALSSYGCRFGFVTILGFLVGYFAQLGASIWMYQPLAYSVLNGLYALTGFAVVGAILARFVTREAAAQP